MLAHFTAKCCKTDKSSCYSSLALFKHYISYRLFSSSIATTLIHPQTKHQTTILLKVTVAGFFSYRQWNLILTLWHKAMALKPQWELQPQQCKHNVHFHMTYWKRKKDPSKMAIINAVQKSSSPIYNWSTINSWAETVN